MSATNNPLRAAGSESGGPPIDVQYVIPPERMAEALARLEVITEFLEEIERLGLGTEPPRMTFDPSWDDR